MGVMSGCQYSLPKIPPTSLTASVSEYCSEMDTVCMFVSDECTVAAHDRVTVGSLCAYTLLSHLFLDLVHYPSMHSASFAASLAIHNSMIHDRFWVYAGNK